MQSLHYVCAMLFGAWLGAGRPDYARGAIWTFGVALVLTLLTMVIEGMRSPPRGSQRPRAAERTLHLPLPRHRLRDLGGGHSLRRLLYLAGMRG